MSSYDRGTEVRADGERFFIACPMSSFATEALYSAFRERVLRFCGRLAASPLAEDVFFAGTHIGGFDAFDATVDAFKTDADAIWCCDHFVLLYPEKILSSALVEAGIAIGLRKRVSIVCRDRADLPYVLRSGDASESTHVEHLSILISDFSDDGLAEVADGMANVDTRVAAE